MKAVRHAKNYALTPDEATLMLAYNEYPQMDLQARNPAIIACLYYWGVRASELCNIDLADLDLVNQTVIIRKGKGGKMRTNPVNDRLVGMLGEWLAFRGSEPGPLFTTRSGKRLVRSQLNRLVALVSTRTIGREVWPHVLRASFATNMSNAGVDSLVLRDLMGHESVATTQMYVSVSMESKKNAVDCL